jgi:DNA polymerase-1
VQIETLAKRALPPPYLPVDRPDHLPAVLAALEQADLVGLDTETTGLDPRQDRLRLLSLGCDTVESGTFAYLVDCFAVDPRPLLEALADKALVIHNADFDLGFLARLGFVPSGPVHDTMLLSRLLHAGEGWGTKHDLGACAERELGRPLDKGEQRSDWSGPLTAAQLAYAAADVEVLRPLYAALAEKIAGADLERAAGIERGCLPAVAWMSRHGVAVDREAWSALVGKAEEDAARLRKEMAEQGPTRPGEMFPSWNWDSPLDLKGMFQALGFAVEDTADETLARIDHPLAGMLRAYREATKRTGTYGRAWLKHISADGRVYPSWNQLGSEAGRMSCSGPNMQQLPRDEAYRRCVVAPPGRVLVKADYSQIELRIAAKVSGDEALLAAYRDGVDVHRQTAQRVLGKEEVTRDDRQLAKALNFGLLYGMGKDRFRENARAEYGIELTPAQAEEYRSAFFLAYPGLRAWHKRTGRTGEKPLDTRTLAGRRRLGVTRFTEKLNTPVQGTGADGLKLALALLWERRHEVPGAFPVLAVHDEIVVECDAGQAEAVRAWLRQAMLDAMAPLLDPLPVEVEVKIARTWGGDPPPPAPAPTPAPAPAPTPAAPPPGTTPPPSRREATMYERSKAGY